MRRPALCVVLFVVSRALGEAQTTIQRQELVRSFNPRRNASSSITPLQVGNGDFAFGVDITGLQTFHPFATLSTWGWHNFSLPSTANQTSVDGTAPCCVACVGGVCEIGEEEQRREGS